MPGRSCRPGSRPGWSTRFGDDAARRLRDDPWRLLELPDVAGGRGRPGRGARVPGRPPGRPAPRPGAGRARAEPGRPGRPHRRSRSSWCWPRSAPRASPTRPARSAAAIEAGTVHDARPDGDRAVAWQRLAMAEDAVAEAIARLAATAEPIEPADARARAATTWTTSSAARSTRSLRHGVSVLTGGPGTGKSRTVAALVALAEKRGLAVALAAPTGRAAKRLEELGRQRPRPPCTGCSAPRDRTGGVRPRRGVAAGRRAGRRRRDVACSTSSWPPRCSTPAPTAPTCCSSATRPSCRRSGRAGCWAT